MKPQQPSQRAIDAANAFTTALLAPTATLPCGHCGAPIRVGTSPAELCPRCTWLVWRPELLDAEEG